MGLLKKEIWIFTIVAILILGIGFFVFKSGITGLVISEENIYADTIDVDFDSDTHYIWMPKEKGLLKFYWGFVGITSLVTLLFVTIAFSFNLESWLWPDQTARLRAVLRHSSALPAQRPG